MKPLHLEVRHWMHEQGVEYTPDEVLEILARQKEWIASLTPAVAERVINDPQSNPLVKGLVTIIMRYKQNGSSLPESD